MAESGETPPHHHCTHHRHSRRRRILICLCFVVLVLLLLAAAAAIIILAVLRPRDPTTELLSANVTGVAPRVVPLPTVSIQLNITLLIVVRVHNPNPAAFDHGAASTLLLYRGTPVGEAVLPAGTVPSHGATTVRLNVTVQADRVVAAAGLGALLGDVLAGEMEFETRSDVRGKVRFLGFVKRRAEARSVCHVVVALADVKVRRQDCQNDTKL